MVREVSRTATFGTANRCCGSGSLQQYWSGSIEFFSKILLQRQPTTINGHFIVSPLPNCAASINLYSPIFIGRCGVVGVCRWECIGHAYSEAVHLPQREAWMPYALPPTTPQRPMNIGLYELILSFLNKRPGCTYRIGIKRYSIYFYSNNFAWNLSQIHHLGYSVLALQMQYTNEYPSFVVAILLNVDFRVDGNSRWRKTSIIPLRTTN